MQESKYYIVCEQSTICCVQTFQDAFFFTFCMYYVFNLEYPKHSQNLLFLAQDHILGYPDNTYKLHIGVNRPEKILLKFHLFASFINLYNLVRDKILVKI